MSLRPLGINFPAVGPRSWALQGIPDLGRTLVYDTFTDTNGVPLTSHVPNIAPGGWVAGRGTFDIQSNRASWLTNGTPADSIQTIDTGRSDCALSAIVQMNSVYTSVGIAFRVLDADNSFFAAIQTDIFYVLRQIAGVPALLDTKSFTLPQNGDHVIRVALYGSSIIATLDGAHEMSITDANFQTETKHGLLADDAATCDEFLVTV